MAESEAADWTVHLKTYGRLRDVPDAVMRRTPDGGYQFRRDGKVVFEAPPGEVSFVGEKEPEMTLPANCMIAIPPAAADLHREQVKALAKAINDGFAMTGIQARVTLAHVDGWLEDGL